VKKFASSDSLIAFARSFAAGHLDRFEKDIAICLTGMMWRERFEPTHAYFPALVSCIGVQELFSGLYGGKLDPITFENVKGFTTRFMPGTYSDLSLKVLYNCFRHKVAHLAHPYDVFDTRTKAAFDGEPSMRITWVVSEEDREEAMRLETLPEARLIKRAPDDWDVKYNQIVHVSIPRLKTNIVAAIGRYLDELEKEQSRRDNFELCMNEYFTP
jgi:hypothetical protein